MIKNYIQLGDYAFIEIPNKTKAEKYITELGIGVHKWSENDIQYGFSRYGNRNQFKINFYVSVGFHYHIYNVFVDATEAECCGVTMTDGDFWKAHIVDKGFENENLIKPKTKYVVIRILLTYPIPHISEIIAKLEEKVNEICLSQVESKELKDGSYAFSYMGEYIGNNLTHLQITGFRIRRYTDAVKDYEEAKKYFESIT